MNVRRKRHGLLFVEESLADLAHYHLSVDPETDARVWHQTLDLASVHDLTSYDACYLELAIS